MTDRRADKPGERGAGAAADTRSYIPAMEDIEFLHGEAARAVRLQLDYLKPQQQMKEHGVEHTVVVFGSTRIVEGQAARAALERAERAVASNPEDPELQRQMGVASRIRDNSRYYDVAREFAEARQAGALDIDVFGESAGFISSHQEAAHFMQGLCDEAEKCLRTSSRLVS